MTEYDIGDAFRAVEDELIKSMMRNMDRHRAEETREGLQWGMWQAEQLKTLEKYKRENQKRYGRRFKDINRETGELIRQARQTGNMQQEIRILQAIKKGFKVHGRNKSPSHKAMSAEFFKLNDRKLEALIKATTHDVRRAETAILRMANDQYRKVIFNAQVYANSGAGTYEKAVDMATKDMLASGLNCVEYKNGARHTLADYADMAIRTASKRAYLQGEGEKRQEWGIATVIVNKRGNPCPKCLPFCGKVLIDDVWSGGKKGDGPYPLMSTAIAAGLYHPRCKDSHTTYFPGISTADDKWTKAEVKAVDRNYRREQKRRHAGGQAEKFGRLAEGSLDPENAKKYELTAGKWKGKSEPEAGMVDITGKREQFVERLRNDNNPSKHKAMLARYAEMTELEEDSELSAPFAYAPDDDIIKYNSKAPHIGDYDLDYVFAHETSHRMDVLEYHSWEDKRFLKAIEDCQKNVYDNKKMVSAWFEGGGKYENSFAISDIVSALTDSEVSGMVGHSKEYWSKPGCKALELFANISAADALGLPEKMELKGILKELFEAYKEMVK